jgi:hypothetical protein
MVSDEVEVCFVAMPNRLGLHMHVLSDAPLRGRVTQGFFR